MNKEQEQGFFSRIEEVLQTHEETYELGAWEEFDANRKKKKRRWPMYAWAAAAVVLLCLGFGLFEVTTKKTLQNDGKTVKNLKKQQNNPTLSTEKMEVKPLQQPLQNKRMVASNRYETPANKTRIQTNLPSPAQQPAPSAPIAAAPSIAYNDKPIVQKQDRNIQVLPGTYDSLANPN